MSVASEVSLLSWRFIVNGNHVARNFFDSQAEWRIITRRDRLVLSNQKIGRDVHFGQPTVRWRPIFLHRLQLKYVSDLKFNRVLDMPFDSTTGHVTELPIYIRNRISDTISQYMPSINDTSFPDTPSFFSIK